MSRLGRIDTLITETIGTWTIDADPEKTAECYAVMGSGAASSCECPGCANYLTVRRTHIPCRMAELLDTLGVNSEKEVSVRRVAPLDSGHSLYAGSFALVGRIVEGIEDDSVGIWRRDVFEQLAPGVEVALRKWKEPPSPWAEAGGVLRLRFLMVLPWVGEDPSAPVDLSGCKGPVDRIDWEDH